MLVAYRGTRLDDTQFDYNPYPQSLFSMAGVVEGWQEVLQLFNGGIYVDEPNSPNPARYTNYGAGVMFIPSGLGYYNQVSGNLGSYQSMVFTFKMYQVQYGDLDNDGIESRYENDPADPTKDLGMVDTDGDNIPDYLDADDDGEHNDAREVHLVLDGVEGHGAQTRSTGLRAPLPRSKAKPKAVAATPASRPGSVADQQARARGFALDLNAGGPDGEDAEFGRAA
jgi:hypothetical protein